MTIESIIIVPATPQVYDMPWITVKMKNIGTSESPTSTLSVQNRFGTDEYGKHAKVWSTSGIRILAPGETFIIQETGQ